MIGFWGLQLQCSERKQVEIEDGMVLNIQSISLNLKQVADEHVRYVVHVEKNGVKHGLCSLKCNGQENMKLDLVIGNDDDITLELERVDIQSGKTVKEDKNGVSLVGFFQPSPEDEDFELDEDEEEDNDMTAQIAKAMQQVVKERESVQPVVEEFLEESKMEVETIEETKDAEKDAEIIAENNKSVPEPVAEPLKDQEDTTMAVEAVLSSKAIVTPSKEKVSPNKAVVKPSKEKVSPNKAVVKPNKAKVTPNKAKVTPNKAKVTPGKESKKNLKRKGSVVKVAEKETKVVTFAKNLEQHAKETGSKKKKSKRGKKQHK